jgi:hypothetical protein
MQTKAKASPNRETAAPGRITAVPKDVTTKQRRGDFIPQAQRRVQAKKDPDQCSARSYAVP